MEHRGSVGALVRCVLVRCVLAWCVPACCVLAVPARSLAVPPGEPPPDSRPASTSGEVSDLRARLAASPDDVDLRLRLATVLSWGGEREAARAEALRIVAAAPRYWDAHILLARLDAWEGSYGAARQRLEAVLEQEPGNLPAASLLVDVEIWADRPAHAERLLARYLPQQQDAETLLKLARAAWLGMSTLRAYRLARRAAELDPANQQVREFLAQLPLVAVDLAQQTEVITFDRPQAAQRQTLAVTALPRARLSGTLIHELCWRFSTLDQRLALQLAGRVTRDVTLTVLGGVGYPAEVVPDRTVAIGLTAQLMQPWDFALSYTYDRLPDASTLHRARLDQGFFLPHDLRVQVTYFGGALAGSGGADDLHAAELRPSWNPQGLEVYARYAYGMELYLASPDAAHWEGFGSLRSHALGAGTIAELTDRLTLRADYGIQLRDNDSEVHSLLLAGRMWF